MDINNVCNEGESKDSDALGVKFYYTLSSEAMHGTTSVLMRHFG